MRGRGGPFGIAAGVLGRSAGGEQEVRPVVLSCEFDEASFDESAKGFGCVLAIEDFEQVIVGQLPGQSFGGHGDLPAQTSCLSVTDNVQVLFRFCKACIWPTRPVPLTTARARPSWPVR